MLKTYGTRWILLCAAAVACTPAQVQRPDGLEHLAASPHRSARNVARDGARHPVEALKYFEVRPDSTVVEILPGSAGYYMEILAPYLKERGRYIAADRDESAAPQYLADHQRLLQRLKAEPGLYGKVVVTKFNADRHEIAPAGSADFVLTFRNLHNWLERGELEGALRAFHKALKPGGVLGVVDHRGRTELTQEAQMKTGYVREDVAIALIERAASGCSAARKSTPIRRTARIIRRACGACRRPIASRTRTARSTRRSARATVLPSSS